MTEETNGERQATELDAASPADVGTPIPSTPFATWRPEFFAPARSTWWWVVVPGRKRPHRPAWGALVQARNSRGKVFAEVQTAFPMTCMRVGGWLLHIPPLRAFLDGFEEPVGPRAGDGWLEIWYSHTPTALNLVRRRRAAIRKATPWRPWEAIELVSNACEIADERRSREVRAALAKSVEWYRRTRRRLHRRPTLTARQRRLSQLLAAVRQRPATHSTQPAATTDSGAVSGVDTANFPAQTLVRRGHDTRRPDAALPRGEEGATHVGGAGSAPDPVA